MIIKVISFLQFFLENTFLELKRCHQFEKINHLPKIKEQDYEII